MYTQNIIDALERTPIIAATDSAGWQSALESDVEVLFHLSANIMTIANDIRNAKANNKHIFVHIDLAEGIGKDKTGIKWLSGLGVDGVITTKAQLVRSAKECGLTAIQRFFVLDSKGMNFSRKVLPVFPLTTIPIGVSLFGSSFVGPSFTVFTIPVIFFNR